MYNRGLCYYFLLVVFAGASASAKSHPFSLEFESKVQQLFLEKGNPSNGKINKYIEKLKQKQSEIRSILIGAEKMNGAKDSKKIEKKAEKSDSVIALGSAILNLEMMKKAVNQEEIMSRAHAALDIENSIRIEGKKDAVAETLNKISTFLVTWKIPIFPPSMQEATNLYDTRSGKFLSTADIDALRRANIDLSKYNPMPNSEFWQQQANISSVSVDDAAAGKTLDIYRQTKIEIPKDNVFFIDEVKYSDTKPKLDAYAFEGGDPQGKKLKYKLKFGEEIHSEPTVSALMMTLGFGADVDVYKRNIKVVLGKRDIHDLTRDWEYYYPREDGLKNYQIENYILEQGVDKTLGNYIIFKEGLVEVRPKGINRLGGWGFSENSNDSLREVRALMLVQMWLDNTDLREFENNRLLYKEAEDGSIQLGHIISDVGHTLGNLFQEMPDIFSSKMIEDRDEKSIEMKFRTVHENGIKNKLTYSDVKWGTRLIAQLTRRQIERAVSLGNWPECVQKIYVEKLISRRNDLVAQFGLVGEVQADGRVIQLTPIQGNIEDYKTSKLCDKKEIKRNFTYGFSSDLGVFLTPIAKNSWNGLLDFVRSGIGSQSRFVINTGDFKSDFNGISEVILNTKREIERNPNPTSEKDLYMVKDELRVGFRLGVAYGPFVDTTYTRNFTLVYPVRSMNEARYNNGFIVNVLLPNDIRRGSLPESYVLKTEHYLEKGIGVEFNAEITMLWPSLKAGISRINLWRSIYDHRNPGKHILYRDRSDMTQTSLQALVKFAVVKIPVFTALSRWGRALGKGLVLDTDEDIHQAVVEGNFERFESDEKQFFIADQFKEKFREWNFIIWKQQTKKRLDHLKLSENSFDSDSLQYKITKQSQLKILSNKVHKKLSVEVFSDLKKANNFQIGISVLGMDSSTSDREMSRDYISFVNGLSGDKAKVISLTPELGYTTNGRWGSVVMMSDSEYSAEALNKILNMTEPDFWKSFGKKLHISDLQVEEMRQSAKEFHDQRNQTGVINEQMLLKSLNITKDQYELVSQSESFVKKIIQLKRESNLEKKIKLLAEAFKKAVYVDSRGFYESGILGVLNGMIGPDLFYSRNMITSPQFMETNMLEEKPLFGEIGRPLARDLKYMIFAPETAMDLYTMFDSWF